jgi:CRP-like cAMP-binding protein
MDLLDLVDEFETEPEAPADGGRFVAFADWSPDALAGLRGFGTRATVDAGAEAVRADSTDRDLFVVASGELEVWSVSSAPRLLARLGPNDMFGEMSFVDGLPRSASVRAVSTSELVRITPEDLADLAEREPQLAIAFLREVARILSRRLRRLEAD